MEKRRLPFLIMGILSSLIFFLPVSIDAKAPPLKNLDHPRLIETEELAGVLNHPSVRIVDLRTSFLDYLKGHIPNSVYLNFENLRVPRNGIPAQFPDTSFLEKLIGEYLSISNDMWVVLYSEKSNPNATSLLWVFDFLGHKKVSVLNGGWEKWVSENHPTTQTYPSLQPKRFSGGIGRIKRVSLAERRWVQDRLSTKNVVIVDARSSAQYSGEEGEEIRRGHIPGAKNIFWETTLEGEEVRVWKKKEDLEKLFAESGVVKNKEVIVYCLTAREASHLYFTLKYLLEFPDVRLYQGSWVEWTADRNLPIKMGMDP
jgi:thiosulfate/3-mercaptopyruvate sulfurtransferase